MPPKRKNRVTKTPSTTPLKAPPAAIRASSQAKRRNSLQGTKTSRLLPSEPLHMTTRRAAKTASNHTSSGAPSIASSSSRRSSLNDLAHYEDAHSEIEDERPAKRTRLSTDSGSPRVSMRSFADQLAVNGTQTPESEKPASRSASNDSKASGKKRRASDGSSQSSKTVSARLNGVLTQTQSDLSDLQPRRKKRRTTKTPAEFADQPPELTDDASTAPNSPEQLADVESSQNLHHVLPTNGDAPTKLGRRLPGRRRAPHADINVEIDLRRQLNLKMSYRSLAKVQKNILEELSSRATNELENDPEYYKRCPEYEPLMATLDQHKARRLAQVHAVRNNKLEQLERVRVATEHIEKEKYVQRFKDLQEDLLLQCFYRMKQLEREMKGQHGDATDDEDNIVAATHVEFPAVDDDDRLGSKFASRSRAYVETDRLLNQEIRRKRFDQTRKAFVAAEEDADDSIDDIPGGFAPFIGPDRTEALAHWNIMNLAEAAIDVETAPPPPPPPKVIPNEQADALFLLASLSADAPRGIPFVETRIKQEHVSAPIYAATNSSPTELRREASPIAAIRPTMTSASTDIHGAYGKAQHEQSVLRHGSPRREMNGVQPLPQPEATKNETPARSTHRIMDILNDDSVVPVSRPRESQPPVRDQTPVATASRRLSVNHGLTPSRSGPLGLDAIVHRQEAHSERSSSNVQAASLPPPSDAPPSSPSAYRYDPTWTTPRLPSYMKGMNEESLRRRDPLKAIRALLETKATASGRIAPSQRPGNPESISKIAPDRERVQTTAPLLSQPFSPSTNYERQDITSRDTRKPSSAYNASPSAPPLSYTQSPGSAPVYPPPRRGSQDPAMSQWERDRRLSASQAPQQPYAGSPPQHYQTEPNRPGPHQPSHQSPYSTPSAPQLPSISHGLSQKPPGPPGPPGPSGPPSSGPVNYRFAHYDPAPPRPPYPSPSPSSYPPASYPSPHGGPPPPHPQQSPAYSAPPPPSYQSGYVPPPGSFQAPPPPPQNMSQYPPLKIHQYGGQPILPANMAPPPPHSQPPMSYVGQPAPPPAYSPPQHHPSYDQQAASPIGPPPRDASAERPSDGQRQRRQYRSYHAPGTQFRSYQGPDSGRRRGG